MKFTTTLLVFFLITACSGSGSSGSADPQSEIFTEVYSADLAPLNNSSATGNARVNILNDNLQVNLTLNNADGGIHPQHIQVGTRCPVLEQDDANHNGKIDPEEALKAYGDSLVNLGDDLTRNGGGFPNGSNYKYDSLASLSQLLGNLNIAKLILQGHVVTVLGLTAVGAAVPIACGVLKRVE